MYALSLNGISILSQSFVAGWLEGATLLLAFVPLFEVPVSMIATLQILKCIRLFYLLNSDLKIKITFQYLAICIGLSLSLLFAKSLLLRVDQFVVRLITNISNFWNDPDYWRFVDVDGSECFTVHSMYVFNLSMYESNTSLMYLYATINIETSFQNVL